MDSVRKAPVLSRVLFFLKEDPLSIPWLPELLEELEREGIKAVFPPVGEADGNGCFIITDSDEGADFARAAEAGFMAMAPAEEGWLFQGAECVFEDFSEITADFVNKMFERFHEIPWTILETERTVLREMTLEDLDDLYRLYEEEGVAEYIGSLCEDRDEERAFEEAYIRTMYRFFGYGIWLVLDRSSGEIIGRAGVSHREGYDELEIGYLLAEHYRHKGIAREVVSAVIEYAGRVLGQERLNAFVDEGNLPSCRLVEGLGFQPLGKALIEGRERIHYRLDTDNFKGFDKLKRRKS